MSRTQNTHIHTLSLFGGRVSLKKKKNTKKQKNHPFEDYDSGNLLGFFFSPLRKLHAKDTTYRISLNNTTPRQGQGYIWGRGILSLLLYVLFLILKLFFVPLNGISEMAVDGGCRGAGRMGEKQKAVQIRDFKQILRATGR